MKLVIQGEKMGTPSVFEQAIVAEGDLDPCTGLLIEDAFVSPLHARALSTPRAHAADLWPLKAMAARGNLPTCLAERSTRPPAWLTRI